MQILYGNNNLEEEKLNEAKMHNMVVEEESIAKGKRAKHDYKMHILNDFNKLKEKCMSVEDIIAIFPDMEKFYDR